MNKHWWQVVAGGLATLAAIIAAVRWPEHTLGIVLTCAVLLVTWVLLALQRRTPVNYKSLSVSATRIVYVDLANEVHIIAFDAITRIEFVREEAMFPCLDGPYLETKWMIHTSGGARIEVMDESLHRALLVRAFARYLRGFSYTTASAALNAHEKAGTWLCYSTTGERATATVSPA